MLESVALDVINGAIVDYTAKESLLERAAKGLGVGAAGPLAVRGLPALR